LGQLTAMGFAADAARKSLASTRGDVAAAAEALMECPPTEQRRSRMPRAETPPQRPSHVPVARAKGRGPCTLAELSEMAKDVALRVLAGPDGTRKGMVERSIRRGRIAMRRNAWEDHEDDARLAQLSPAYGRLKGYQKAGVRWLLGLAEIGLGGILADEMGLGKTAQTLTFLDLVTRVEHPSSDGLQPTTCPSLVVAPVTLLDTWETEAQNWCPHLCPFRYHASAAADRRELEETYFAEHDGKCRLILTTPNLLHNQEDRAFFRRISFKYLVLDEAHGMKNSGASRFRDVQRGLRVQRRLLLTGTPVHNSLRELANLLTLVIAARTVEPGKKNPVAGVLADLEAVVERGALRTLQVRAAPLILRRLKCDVMRELPAKTGHTVRCPLVPAQRALYDRELASARAQAAQRKAPGGKRGQQEFVRNLFCRLRRVCNHTLLAQSRLSDDDYVRLVEALRRVRPDYQRATPARCMEEVRGWSDFEVILAVREHGMAERLGKNFVASHSDIMEGSSKIQELIRLLTSQREAQQKTLIFSQYTQFLDIIAEALEGAGFIYGRLDGNVRLDMRSQVVNRFMTQGSGMDVFLLSTKAGGTGLNLTAADKVVLMDLSFNPQTNRQAEDRAHRLGQQRPVGVHYLVCADTVEEAVLQANLRKMSLDYKFGGQRMLLQGTGEGQQVAEPDEDEDGDEDEEELDAQQEEKKAEQAVLAQLESAFASPAVGMA